MRIDRLLCELNIGTRSQAKELLKKGLVYADGNQIKKADTQVDETQVVITCQGREYRYCPFVYYMLNKPGGVVSATKDEDDITVMDVFKEAYLKTHEGEISGIPFQDMFPVGRLDKDTVGLLLLTNDGELAHKLLSPKKHVPKKYLVRVNGTISLENAQKLETGVSIGEKELTAPAVMEVFKEDPSRCFLTITEGKFHQVKRMFQAIGLNVIYLKRMSMGSLCLDPDLKEGDIRELTEEEVLGLRKG